MYRPIVIAMGAAAVASCAEPEPAVSHDLPACFEITLESWSEPPPPEYAFEPTHLVLGGDDAYSDVLGEVVGRAARLLGGAGTRGAWAWRARAGLDSVQVFPVNAGISFGGNFLRLSPSGDAYAGTVHWYADWGAGGAAVARFRPVPCTQVDGALAPPDDSLNGSGSVS